MKKFILNTPFIIFLGMCTLTANLDAAGCNSHKNKNDKVECPVSNDYCDKTKSEKSYNKVEA